MQVFKLKSMSVAQFDAFGAQETPTIGDSGILVLFSKENQMAVVLDLQGFNEGASATNSMEQVTQFIVGLGARNGVKPSLMRVFQIDSVGDVDSVRFDGQNNVTFAPLGFEYKDKIAEKVRSAGMMAALLHDQFDEMLKAFNETLKIRGAVLQVENSRLKVRKI